MSDPSKPNLDSLFEAAVGIESAEERAAFLENSCGDNTELRQQVEQLLASHEQAGSLPDKPPAELEATIVQDISGESLAASLDAGLAPAFADDKAVVVGGAGHTVLKMLGHTIDLPRVVLRESQAEEDEPIQRPNSPEIPKSDSDSRYRLDGEIARGGMGAIIKGRDTDLGRDLAIKVLLDAHKDKPEVIQRFVEEAQIGGQLQHPGIAPIYELGQFADKRPFFAMKLVKGQTLSKLLADRDDADDERGKFIGIFEQVCQTMAYTHSRGVIHRDLKPANIMVGAFGEVQVMDWGLAKVLQVGGVADEKKSQHLQQGQSIIQTLRSGVGSEAPAFGSAGSVTQMGSVMGTPAYMPPEQALGEIDNMDERADVFGLGAILCEILTGQPPYVADDGTRVFRMASRGKLDNAFSRLDACEADEDLIALTKHCLELEPVDRPRDAGALAERVTGYLESVEAKLRDAEVERAAEAARADAEADKALAESARAEAESARAGAEHKRRRTSLALAASVLLLVGLGSGGWLYIERQEVKRQEAALLVQTNHATEMEALAEQREEQRTAARKAQAAAEQDRAAAIAAEERGRRLLYATDMQLAPLLWKDDDATVAELRSRLDAHDPMKNAALEGKADLRGFEWHYYQHLLAHSAKVFGGPDNPIIDGVLMPNGQLVTLNSRLQVQRWDLETQLPAGATLELGADNRDGPSVLSPDGKLAAIAMGGRIQVVDTTDGAQSFEIESASDNRIMTFSADGKMLVTVDEQVRWWDTADGQLAASAEAPDSVWSRDPILSVSTDGRALAVGAYGGESWIGNLYSIYRLDEDSQVTMQNEFSFGGSIGSLALSADGGLIAISSSFGGPLIVYDALTGEQNLAHNSRHPSPISALRFSANGSQLVTAAQDGMSKVWSDKAFAELRQTLKGHQEAVNKLAFSPDETKLVSVSSDQTARVWDVATGVPLAQELARTTEQDVAFSADGLLVATAEENRVILRDAVTGQPLRILVDEGEPITSLALSKDGRLLACGHYPSGPKVYCRSRVTLWEIDTGRRLAQFAGEQRGHIVYDLLDTLAFSPDGKFLVAGFGSRNSHFTNWSRLPIKCWEIASGRPLLLFGHQNVCVSIQFSPDGETMASASHDGTVRLWRTKNWQPMGEPLDCGDRSVNCAAFSPDGHLLAAGDTNGIITLWDIQTGMAVRTLAGHANHVNSLAFSPDGRTLASGSLDQTIRLWNTATWRELMGLDYHAGDLGAVVTLAFSPDGRTLLANGDRVLTWSSRTAIWTHVERVAARLEELLDSEVDFASRIRMFSGNPRLHEALAELHGRRPDDRQVKAALDATLAQALQEDGKHDADAAPAERVLTTVDKSETASVADATAEVEYWRKAMVERTKRFSAHSEFSTALLMDGFTYLAAPHVPFDDYDAFTVEAWVMDWNGHLLQQGEPGEPENSVFFKPGTHSGWESNGGYNFTSPLSDLPAGRWNHVAMVFDGTTQKLFLNGQVQHERAAPKPGKLTSSRTMYVGAQTTADGPIASGEGCLAAFRISSSAKYSERFVPERHLRATDDTVLLYIASQDATDMGTLRDVTGNERHAKICGSPRWLIREPTASKDKHR